MHGICYVDLINQQFSDYSAKLVNLQNNIASTDVKISTFSEKTGEDEASWNGPLREWYHSGHWDIDQCTM